VLAGRNDESFAETLRAGHAFCKQIGTERMEMRGVTERALGFWNEMKHARGCQSEVENRKFVHVLLYCEVSCDIQKSPQNAKITRRR
jgi:hypothetical protein